jgi:hypothetical protein
MPPNTMQPLETTTDEDSKSESDVALEGELTRKDMRKIAGGIRTVNTGVRAGSHPITLLVNRG